MPKAIHLLSNGKTSGSPEFDICENLQERRAHADSETHRALSKHACGKKKCFPKNSKMPQLYISIRQRAPCVSMTTTVESRYTYNCLLDFVKKVLMTHFIQHLKDGNLRPSVALERSTVPQMWYLLHARIS